MVYLVGTAVMLGFGLWRLARNRVPGLWTPERQALYRVALSLETDPARLVSLARKFADDGFPKEAAALRARAKLAGGANVAGEDLRETVRAALGSKNASAVRELADYCEGQGRGATAGVLRDYARGVDVGGRAMRYRGAPLPPSVRPTQAPPAPPPGVPAPPKEAVAKPRLADAARRLGSQVCREAWFLACEPWGDSDETECVLVTTREGPTPVVLDLVPTHFAGVPVRVVSAEERERGAA